MMKYATFLKALEKLGGVRATDAEYISEVLLEMCIDTTDREMLRDILDEKHD